MGIIGMRPGTHAVQAPRILELVLPPRRRYRLRLVVAKVLGELLCYRLGGEERAVRVEGHYNLLLWGGHIETEAKTHEET